MPDCKEMKKGEIYFCTDCEMGLPVVKECKHYSTEEKCKPCTFVCCNEELKKKE